MQIRPFTLDDLENFNSWLSARRMPAVMASELPKIGFICRLERQDLAAMFLRQCEGGFGFIDNLVTNPLASSQARDESQNILSEHIFKVAGERGVRYLMAWTTSKNTLERSIRLGFVKSPATLIVKDLSIR